jgi:Protein of unknown function (DUF2934)
MTENDKGLDYFPEDTVGDQGLRSSTGERQGQLAYSALARTFFHDCVSRVAYQFYLRRGQVPGHDLDDWFAAERIVLSRLGHVRNQPGDQFNGKEEQ